MYSAVELTEPTPLSAAGLELLLAGSKVAAGFPSPAEDFAAKRIDLTSLLVTHPQATFLLRVSGDSMRDAGIFDGDLIVVDKAIKPRHDHVVVANPAMFSRVTACADNPMSRAEALAAAKKVAANGWRAWVEHQGRAHRIFESKAEVDYKANSEASRIIAFAKSNVPGYVEPH